MRVAIGALGDPEVVPLWFGESDLVTPPFIREAAVRALGEGRTFYSFARGHLPLREALVAHHRRLYGIDLDPDRVTVPGSTMLAVVVACLCTVEKDDEVVLITPCWPNVRTVVQLLGGRPVEIRLEEGPTRWWLDFDRVARAIGPRTRAIYVNSPANPTGWIASPEELRALLDLCRRHGLALLSDEVYHRLVYEGRDPAPSVLELADPDEPVFVLNGFSKSYAMTGWRLGWLVHPRRLAEPMAVLAEVLNTGATSFAQYGGIAALRDGEGFVAAFRDRCRRNRDLVLERLGSHPRIDLLPPAGAFYAFPRISGLGDGLAFCRRLLAEEQVGVAAGSGFGAGNAEHIRLCFAVSTDKLERALARIGTFLDRHPEPLGAVHSGQRVAKGG